MIWDRVTPVLLRQIKKALRGAMVGAPDVFILTFKRGDRFTVPCRANDRAIRGNEDHCHVVMKTELLHRLKARQMSSDQTAGVCWKQGIATTATSTWRNERTATTRKNTCNQETMMKIRVVMTFITVQAVLASGHVSSRSMDILD